MKLWGGAGDSGCCSVGDVEDARRVAARLGIDHHVFNFSEEFEAGCRRALCRGARASAGRRTRASSATGTSSSAGSSTGRSGSALTPWPPATTPGSRATLTGVPAVAARAATSARTSHMCLSMLTVRELARVLLPVGEMTKTRGASPRPGPGAAHRYQA